MPVLPQRAPEKALAIVGIAGLFPGSATLEQFWNNIKAGVDSTSEVPVGRWLLDRAAAFDPRIGHADHVYSSRGGFVPRELFDPGDLELGGVKAAALDPVFQLALHVGRAAWRDARTDRLDTARCGVIFGNIVLPVESAAGWSRDVLASGFLEELGLEAKRPEEIEPANVFPAGLPAALVARALGLGGPAYTIDAACATSLYSIALAAAELEAGRADALLCGGVSRPDALYIQMGFSQLRALGPGPAGRRLIRTPTAWSPAKRGDVRAQPPRRRSGARRPDLRARERRRALERLPRRRLRAQQRGPAPRNAAGLSKGRLESVRRRPGRVPRHRRSRRRPGRGPEPQVALGRKRLEPSSIAQSAR